MMNSAQVELIKILAQVTVVEFLADYIAYQEAQTEGHAEAEDGPDAEAA